MNAMRLAQAVQALPLEHLLPERELHQASIGYALLYDGRDWQGIGNIFSDGASATYGSRALPDPMTVTLEFGSRRVPSPAHCAKSVRRTVSRRVFKPKQPDAHVPRAQAAIKK